MSFVDERIDGLEGELRGGATIEPGFEFHGRRAEAKIEAECGVGGGVAA